MFPPTPHPCFTTGLNSTFNFFQVYQIINTEPNSFSVIIQNITHHCALLSREYIGSIEVPATNIKPLHYKDKDETPLIPSVFHSYYPDLSERKPPVVRSSHQKTNIEIINLQPSPFLNRPLLPLPYSPDPQLFLN